MATTLTQEYRLNVSSNFSDTAELATPRSNISKQYKRTTANGTGSGQADLRFQDSARSLAAAATENMDLAGGLTDEYGNTITFATVTGITIKNLNTVTGDNLTIGGAASNPAALWFGATTHTLTIEANQIFHITTDVGWTITGGSADVLKILNDDATNAITFDIIIEGRSA